MTTVKDITGMKFGRLTVISPAGCITGKGMFWNTLCECGKSHRVHGTSLRNGNTRSCGCLLREACERRVTHGATRGSTRGQKFSGTYVSYYAMLRRCTDRNHRQYSMWGGRGIVVCERWLGPDGFIAFRSDMGERPPGYSLERVDVNGNYEPSNCTWIPRNEQSKNTRSTVWLSVNGVRMCQADAARAIGVCQQTLIDRRRKGRPFPPGVTQ